ncbi:MAG: hypothetical protein ABIA97_06595 [Candidatus Omnitrophota bacterium]
MNLKNHKKHVLAVAVTVCVFVFSGCRHIIVAYSSPRRMVVLPAHPVYVPVVISGEEYYYYNGAYYRRVPSGYVVSNVPEAREVIVNVANVNGTYTVVSLKKSGSGYIGPQGEYYPEFPSLEQLQVMYGG